MKLKTFYIFTLLLTVCAATGAQTLQEGRELFTAGDYSAALPIMEKYQRQQPENASRAYWLGVCLFETGRQEDALPYLEKAAGKKIIRAHGYMARYYAEQMMYPEAIDNYERLIDGMSKDRELHDEVLEEQYSKEIEKLKRAYRMLRNTKRVCFIDSFAVSKDNFLKAYILDKSSGSISLYSDVFRNNVEGEVFIPETGSSIIFSRMEQDSIFHLQQGFRSFDEWTDIAPVKLSGTTGNTRFPFVMNDGVTLYYAGDGPESIGGYDIFVTRFNTNTGSYLTSENIGMPFNSSANDYMYAIDETNNLGWFATDRNQPSDSVCVYVFIPDESRLTYSYSDGDTAVIRAAQIASIAESQTDPDAVREAKQRLNLLAFSEVQSESKQEFTFVIDDMNDYHSVEDFKSSDARNLFIQWQEMKKMLESSANKLKNQRELWHSSNHSEQERIRQSLMELENTVELLEHYVISTEIEIRNTEIRYLTR